jgi:hypothetical protein
MKKIFLLLCFLISTLTVFAGLYRAGEITYKHISGLTYEIKLTTYTDIVDTNGVPQIIIEFGDGTNDTILRTGKTFIPSYESVKNTYLWQHTYPGQGSYIISFADTFRTDGIVNIPNSGHIGFYIESLLTINPFLGVNNSPDFMTVPLDQAFLDSIFIYNSATSDTDVDSLVYKLIPCRGDSIDIAGYSYPTASNIFLLDTLTGDLLWDSPVALGDYNIAMLIEEWRLGIEIGYVVRDIQIHVKGTSGVENYFDYDGINIFPNPASGKIQIRRETCLSGRQELEMKSVEIYNMQGQLVKQIPFLQSPNPNEIDMSALAKGVYLLKIQSENGVVNKKLVVQ